MKINSSQIIYSEHGYDECFEYEDGSGRVPEGEAIGYEIMDGIGDDGEFILFEDIKYSEYNHDYWDNYDIEKDVDRLIIP